MRIIFVLGMALAILTIATYFQTVHHEFLLYDDYQYVTKNPHVATGLDTTNISWAFTSFEAANWHPLTWLSHMLDVQLYGLDARGHHLTNMLIHTGSALLLLLFLYQTTGAPWQSFVTAALFALHPLHVESVAWIAERKDVLSAFFGLITLILYARYSKQQRRGPYFLALIAYVCGLMTKPMLITIPLIMLLLDFWPLNRYGTAQQAADPMSLLRLRSLILEKVPFLLCAFLSAVVTISAQHWSGAIRNLQEVSLPLRIGNALTAYLGYLQKTVWPKDLAILYPLPPDYPLGQLFAAMLILSLATGAIWKYRSRFPYLLTGWFWYLITLLPVIGIIPIGDQAMADRYTYVPLIGLFIMASWGIPQLLAPLPFRKGILTLLTITVIAALTALTYRQLGFWRDSITLFRHTLNVTTNNYRIHNNLGVALAQQGDSNGAIAEYLAALHLEPNFIEAHNNLGNAFATRGDFDAAIQAYRQVLSLNPAIPEAHNNLGFALAQQGNLTAAIAEYQEALRLRPDFAAARYNLRTAQENQAQESTRRIENH
jgi:hypothetical protein